MKMKLGIITALAVLTVGGFWLYRKVLGELDGIVLRDLDGNPDTYRKKGAI